MTVFKLHFTRKETNQYDKLQAYIIINHSNQITQESCA